MRYLMNKDTMTFDCVLSLNSIKELIRHNVSNSFIGFANPYAHY